jgi:hypothetical protein
MNMDPSCNYAGYNNGTAGNLICGIYIGVQCDQSEVICAYKLSLQVFENNTYTN